ncbi:hypothetical protein [Endozoicomonas sp. 8E]|uniref:hypothetical protein n=1 Tax=Endozoicomonas sp. 8E TaxID=3035692 RepID=UPI0029393D25|nr:hypothetical protein [Endozoicomonas sp. 8E]WOG25929.1 hypothetical protein P6910_15265 [Endozoicomonas sp. 8E]
MKFYDLMDVPHNKDTRCIDIAFLQEKLPNTPLTILKQVYSDHGRNIDFQDQYADLDLSVIEWSLEEIPATEITGSSFYPGFSTWFQGVSQRTLQFVSKGWNCIDVRPQVIEHWKENSTWVEPPVIFSNSVYTIGSNFHLVEGHTRVALLKGLVESAILPENSGHKIWVGRASSSQLTEA